MQRISSMVIGLLYVAMTAFLIASCDLSPRPQNQYAKFNDETVVVFECHSTLKHPVTWLVSKPGSSSRCEIFNGYNLVEDVQNVSSYCRVDDGTPGKYNLSVKSTTEAAQRYICLEPGSLDEASADFTIIESDPECNATSYNESIIFACQVRFRGNWGPVMEWRNGTSGEVISEGVYAVSIPNKSLTSFLILPSNQSMVYKIHYTCKTHFRIQDKPLETTADNIPSYSYMYDWTSEEYIAAYEHEGILASGSITAASISVPIIVVGVLTRFCPVFHYWNMIIVIHFL